MSKHLHFSEAEFADRRARTCAEMVKRGQSALLMFRQESMYYLTGYDTFGYVFFQCIVLTDDGRMVLLTRSADLRQAHFTSVVDDVRIWADGDDAQPAQDLKGILQELGLDGKTLGVELEAYGLTARNGQRLYEALEGFAKLEDASDLVSKQRLVKSPAEIAYVRRAAELCDDCWYAGEAAAKPGAFEGDILADMQSAVIRGGGDDPANEFIIGSGPGALMCRYFTGRRTLDSQDQLTLEFAGAYRHYHAAMMRTVVLGKVPPRQQQLWAAAREALLACEDALRPGEPVARVFDAHARVLDAHGLREHRLNACGYSLGTTYAPNWMDWPMLYAGNTVIAQPGMVYFMHMIIFDSDAGYAATLGRTSLVGDTAAEPLSKAALNLTVVS